MLPSPISRRRFLATVPAGTASLALCRSPGLFAAATPQPRVGCQANGFTLKAGDFPGLLDALRQMKALGYAGFECNIRFVEGEFDRATEARRRIADTGVEFVGIHTNMNNAKPEVFPRWVEKVAAMGGSTIVMSGPGLAKDGRFTSEALQQKAATLNALGAACRQGGLKLAYHNHNPEFARNNAEMNGLADHTDRLDFMMDAGHAKLGGGDPAAFMRKYSARIVGCHLKTYKELVQVPLGQGDWDFVDLSEAIKATRWAGWLINEEGGGTRGGNTAALKPDREYIRKVFGV